MNESSNENLCCVCAEQRGCVFAELPDTPDNRDRIAACLSPHWAKLVEGKTENDGTVNAVVCYSCKDVLKLAEEEDELDAALDESESLHLESDFNEELQLTCA